MGSPGAGVTASRHLSGLAHARTGVLLRDWTIEAPDPDHTQLVRIQDSEGELVSFALPAVVCIWRGGATALTALGRPLLEAQASELDRLIGLIVQGAR